MPHPCDAMGFLHGPVRRQLVDASTAPTVAGKVAR